jgi:hypothetical protein
LSIPAQDDTVFSTGVNVVSVIATVRDQAGRLVNNLGKDDFVLKEDNKEQAIQYFAQQTDLPLTLGLLVDTSMSQRRVLDQEKKASNIGGRSTSLPSGAASRRQRDRAGARDRRRR